MHGLTAGLIDRHNRRSLGYNVEQTVRAASAVRDRLSTDNWRVLNRLLQLFTRETRVPDLDAALELIDRALFSLAAVGGLEMAHMSRDDGWRFLSLGRHLERLHFVSCTLSDVAPDQATAGSGLLEWLLELSDSLLTYRVRHKQHPEWESVVDLMLVDERNPRSATFQLAKLVKHVSLLPDAGLIDVLADMEQLLHDCRSDINTEQGELFGRGEQRLETLLMGCQNISLRLGAALSLRYFSHVDDVSAFDGRPMSDGLYRIEHETRYVHRGGVSTSQHVAHLTPRTLPRQRVRWHDLAIEPTPASHVKRLDYFGNAVDQFTILTPYDELRVVGRSLVEVMEPSRRAVSMPARHGKRSATSFATGAARGTQTRRSSAIRRLTPSRRRSWPRLRASRLRRSGHWSRVPSISCTGFTKSSASIPDRRRSPRR